MGEIFEKWERAGVEFGAQTLEEYAPQVRVRLFRCPECGFAVFLPIIVGTQSFYSDVTRNEYYLGHRWEFDFVIRLLKKNNVHSVLDAGCGEGAFLKRLHQKFPGVLLHGQDENLSVTAEFPSIASFHASLRDVPSGVDAVTAFQVLEHVHDPLGFARDLVDILRPGGLLALSVPDHAGPVRFFAESHTDIPPHHVTQWKAHSLKRFVTKLGLQTVADGHEPLPDYLFEAYLPAIATHALRWPAGKRMERRMRKLALKFVGYCLRKGIKSLPLRGHSYVLVAKKRPEGIA